MEELQAQINTQMSTVGAPVELWINWMMIIFFSSLLFVWKNREARWALGAIVLTMPTAMLIFKLWGNVHLFSLAHLLWWSPLLVYLIRSFLSQGKFKKWGPLRIWHHLLCATIMISLVFDVRDVYLVLTGVKAMH